MGFDLGKKPTRKCEQVQHHLQTKNGYTIAILSSLERKNLSKRRLPVESLWSNKSKIARNQTITIHSTCKWTIYYLQTTNHIYSDPVAYPPANWDVMMSPRKGLFQKEMSSSNQHFSRETFVFWGAKYWKTQQKTNYIYCLLTAIIPLMRHY